ncbi:MAG: hypothetical protein AABY22_18755 [Nanoarchaeota archaeon]
MKNLTVQQLEILKTILWEWMRDNLADDRGKMVAFLFNAISKEIDDKIPNFEGLQDFVQNINENLEEMLIKTHNVRLNQHGLN